MSETERQVVFLSAGRNSLFVVIIIGEDFCGRLKPIFVEDEISGRHLPGMVMSFHHLSVLRETDWDPVKH